MKDKSISMSALGQTAGILGCLLLIPLAVLAVRAQSPTARDHKNLVQRAQAQLRALGYDAGLPDGVMGARTAGRP